MRQVQFPAGLLKQGLCPNEALSLDLKINSRKTVNMNEQVANELNRMANLQGKTLYSIMNEIGIRALEANRLGFSLEDALLARKRLQSAKRSRMILVNQDLWYFSSSQALKTSRKKWLKLIRAVSEWQSDAFLSVLNQAEFINSINSLIADFFWDCSDLKIEQEDSGNDLTMTLTFTPEMPAGHTQVLFKIFEAMFNAQGYVVTASLVRPGFLIIAVKRIGEEAGKRIRLAHLANGVVA
jgi:hypothetical protein